MRLFSPPWSPGWLGIWNLPSKMFHIKWICTLLVMSSTFLDKCFCGMICSPNWPIASIDALSGLYWEHKAILIWLMDKSRATLEETDSSEHKASNALNRVVWGKILYLRWIGCFRLLAAVSISIPRQTFFLKKFHDRLVLSHLLKKVKYGPLELQSLFPEQLYQRETVCNFFFSCKHLLEQFLQWHILEPMKNLFQQVT